MTLRDHTRTLVSMQFDSILVISLLVSRLEGKLTSFTDDDTIDLPAGAQSFSLMSCPQAFSPPMFAWRGTLIVLSLHSAALARGTIRNAKPSTMTLSIGVSRIRGAGKRSKSPRDE